MTPPNIGEFHKPSKIRLFFNTILGFLLCLCAGGVYAFSLYSQAMRTQMNYTALGNQYVYNFGILGYSLSGIVTGYMLEKWGIRKTLGFAAAVSIFGYILQTLTIRGMYEAPAPAMWIFAFLASIGQGVAQITGLVVNTRNFSFRVRGKIVGTTMSVFAFSPSFFSLIWDNKFVDDPADYTKNGQHLESYFWFLTVFVGGVLTISALFFRLWDYETLKKERTGTGSSSMENIPPESEETILVRSKTDRLRIFEVLKSVSFIVLMLTYTIFKGVDKTYLGDIGKIGQSLGYEDRVAMHVLVSATTSCIVRLLSGFVFDVLYPKVPGWIFLEAAMLILLTIDTFLIFFMAVLFMTYLSTILHSCGAIMYAIMPALCANRFGRQNMAYTWSIMVSAGTLATFAYGGWNSAIYDRVYNSQTGTDGVCRGAECFVAPFTISVITMLLAMILLGLFGRDDKHVEFILERKDTQNMTDAGQIQNNVDVDQLVPIQTYQKLSV